MAAAPPADQKRISRAYYKDIKMTTVMQPGMQMGVQPGMQQVAVGNGKEVAPLVPGGAHHPRSRSISLSIAAPCQ